MRVPNFIIGGSAASGTGFLYELLIQSQEVYLPQNRIPEPHYYYKTLEYAKGFNYYIHTYFKHVPLEAKAIGERSSSYLYGGRAVASKIARDFPDMKFIFMLRNPIQRAWANYRFTVLQGFEDLSFYEALEQEKQRVQSMQGIWREIQPYDYTGRGFYAKQLKEFLEFFPQSQILCIKSESISNDDLSVLPLICNFLEIHSFTPKASPEYPSFSVVNATKQRELRKYFGDRFSYLMNSVRLQEDIYVQEEEKYKELKENLTYTKEQMPQECQEMLIDIFRDDIYELASMVTFDTNSWIEAR